MATAPQPRIFEEDSRLQNSIPGFASDAMLHEITRTAQHASGASGAALVLSDGNLMSCRACSGELGPPVGTRLNTTTGFTASCVQTGEAIRCDDAETDSRVDRSSCRQLGIRSILAVPVFDGQNVAGVLEVLSHDPRKFTDRHAIALRLLARLVETLANYASRDDASPAALTPDTGSKSSNPSPPDISEAKVNCTSCKSPNPQGSQFCNHCGAILFSFLGCEDTDERSQTKDAKDDEGFKQICKIISGDGQATWNEISTRILNEQSAASSTSGTAATPKADEIKAAVRRVSENTGLKKRLEAAVRRNLWL